MAEFYLIARWSNGTISHESMQLAMRAPGKPIEPEWSLYEDGVWRREPTPAAIESYLARVAERVARDPDSRGVTLLGWRPASEEDRAMVHKDRDYRNALEDAGGKLRHNMVKARELHRQVLRHINGDRLLRLDRQWLDASAEGKKAQADSVQAIRQGLKNLVNDPRIDAAQTIDELKAIQPPPESA